MGLAKTLEMISLLASDLRTSSRFDVNSTSPSRTSFRSSTPATLVVAPVSRKYFALGASSRYLLVDSPLHLEGPVGKVGALTQGDVTHTYHFRHLYPDSMHWHIFHGPNRELNLRNDIGFDIILTTYDVVVAEYRKLVKFSCNTSVFSTLWRRFILDEG
jgi:SNF2 family DNA or RNA helicase